ARVPLPLLGDLTEEPDLGQVVLLDRDREPGLLPRRGHPQRLHLRLGQAGAAVRVRLRRRARRPQPAERVGGAPEQARPRMTRSGYFSVARFVAWRNVRVVIRTPSLLLPTILFPLFFLLAFAGALSAMSKVLGGQNYTA